MATNAELTEISRQKIIDAFWDIVFESGLNSANVRTVMARAGMNRSTFYEHFDSIQDLMEKVSEDILAFIREEGKKIIEDEVIANPPDFEEFITKFFYKFSRKVIFLIGSGAVPEFLPKLRDTLKPPVFEIYKIECPKEDEPLIMSFIMSALMGASYNLFDVSPDTDLSAMFRKAYGLIFNGIGQYIKDAHRSSGRCRGVLPVGDEVRSSQKHGRECQQPRVSD